MLGFIMGLVMGVPLGCVLLFLLIAYGGTPKEPPTKDEWKVM